MLQETLSNGGKLVKVTGGSGLAVDGVPGARRGLVVESAVSCANGDGRQRGRYKLTQRATAGTDLWRVARCAPTNA